MLQEYNPLDKVELLQLWWDSWHSSSGFQHPKTIGEWERRFDALLKKSCMRVAVENGLLVGFVMYDTEGPELLQLFVSPKAQRRGVGSDLFDFASESMEGNFSLKVLEEASEARKFYRAKGLLEIGSEVNPFNGHNEIVCRTP